MLNGGGLTQLQTINSELGQALEGRETEVRDTLSQLDTFIGGLDQQKTEINRALDSVNALAAHAGRRHRHDHHRAGHHRPRPGRGQPQRDLLVGMLDSLARLGDVGTRVINQAGANTVEDLKSLQPILSQLAAAGPDLAQSLDIILTYPFPASSLSSLHTRQDQRTGGYALFTNMTATLDLDLRQLLCRYVVDPAHRGAAGGRPDRRRRPGLPSAAGISGGAGTAPAAPGSGGRRRRRPSIVPTLPGLEGVVPDLTQPTGGLLGLPAPGGTP